MAGPLKCAITGVECISKQNRSISKQNRSISKQNESVSKQNGSISKQNGNILKQNGSISNRNRSRFPKPMEVFGNIWKCFLEAKSVKDTLWIGI